MMSAPRLLMLDEPSLGLAPKMVDELLAIARRIADAGTTVLMVEQNVKKALAVADRGYVLERGTLVASGPRKLLARSTVVREAYLGAAESDTTTAADAAQRRKAACQHGGRPRGSGRGGGEQRARQPPARLHAGCNRLK